jgi:cell wall-associated NlpC family hydrolase
MVSRLILGATLGVMLIFSPYLTNQAQAKTTKKKTAACATKAKAGSSKKYAAAKSSSRRYSRTRSTEAEDYTPRQQVSTTPAYTPGRYYSAGICETQPLMKIIPQRDGRFLMEPLSTKKPGADLTTPATVTPRKPLTGKDDYSSLPPRSSVVYPRWNFSDLVLTMAKQYQGMPYSRGGSLENGSTDCSGFVQYIYQGFKIDLPRSSSEQAQVGKTITQEMDFSKLLPGDLLFFRRGGKSVGHAGIYLGNSKMIHASNPRNGITVTDLTQPYYVSTFVVAKRVFEVKHPSL